MSTHRNCKLTECLGRPRCERCLFMDAKEDGGSRTEFEAAALPPLPEWSKRDDFGGADGMLPSEIRTALKDYARLAIATHAAQTERERFEAAAYRYIRRHKHYALLIGDEGFGFTHAQVDHWRNEVNERNVDESVAAAMGWPTVPEVKS